MAELGQDIRRLTNLSYPRAPINVKETLAIEQFIDALINSEMRLKIKQARPVDLNDAIQHAVELESFYRAERRQQGMVRPIINDQSAQAKEIEEMRKEIGDLKQQLESFSVRLKYRPRDDRLPRPPHAQPVKKPRRLNRSKSFNCGSDKHIQRGCLQRKRYVNPRYKGKTPNSRQTRMMGSAGMYATGKVEGHSVECLVDTGATLTLISKSL